MIQKRETCLYCGEKMESKTAKKKFCSPKCKVYWNRESEQRMVIGNGILRDTVNHTDLVEYAKGTADLGKNDVMVEIDFKATTINAYDGKKATYIADEVGQWKKPDGSPTRNKGESGMDYSIRLAEWKEKQTKIIK